MSAGRAPWRYTVCEPTDPGATGIVPLNYAGHDYCENPQIIDADGKKVVGCDEYHVFGAENRVDNVRLMLAAPDLLAALIGLRKSFGEYVGPNCAAADAAIAKATGVAA